MTVSLCIRQGSKRNDDSVSVEELDWSAERQLNTSGVTLNETQTHQQTQCSAAFCRPVKFFHTDWIIISLWSLSYTQRHCHVRIEKSPNCCYKIRSTQFPRISLYAQTLRFVLMEITKVVKPFIRRGANTFGNIVYVDFILTLMNSVALTVYSRRVLPKIATTSIIDHK